MTPPATAELRRRLERARDRAVVLRADSERLRAQLQGRRGSVDPHAFTVHGWVDGNPSLVRWEHGRLHADDATRLRLHLVVSLAVDGELTPALDGTPSQLLLAVMRALDRVDSVVVAVPGVSGGTEGTTAR